jgi:hypothetical protein
MKTSLLIFRRRAVGAAARILSTLYVLSTRRYMYSEVGGNELGTALAQLRRVSRPGTYSSSSTDVVH